MKKRFLRVGGAVLALLVLVALGYAWYRHTHPVVYSSEELVAYQNKLHKELDHETWRESGILLSYIDPEYHGIVMEGVGWTRERKNAIRAKVSRPELLLFVEHETLWYTGRALEVEEKSGGGFYVRLEITESSEKTKEEYDENNNLIDASYTTCEGLSIQIDSPEELLDYEELTLICADIVLTSYPPIITGIDITAGGR